MKQQKGIVTIPQIAAFNTIPKENMVLITDENVFAYHKKKFLNFNVIVIKAGEKFKNQTTVDTIIKKIIQLGANRTTTIVGVGGGVVTDITGYVASIFMRGINFGYVPTTLLSLVDASIGGKNGIDVGVYKNMIGTINQPTFIAEDLSFLNTLPQDEWKNGFAEIIKHACINNKKMFNELQENSIVTYKAKKEKLQLLIQQNATLKATIVAKDIDEKGERKLLNFGHTLGHAIENTYELSHGQAISIGMLFACKLSQEILGFNETDKVRKLLEQYNLPTQFTFDKKIVFDILSKDKKREKRTINYVLLEKIGKGKIVPIDLDFIKSALKKY